MLRLPVIILSICVASCSKEHDPNNANEIKLKSVPRNRTLIMDCPEANTCAGQIQDYNTFNPFIPGSISRIGYNFLFEPLYFFNAYRDDSVLVPWIATKHRFNEDYTQLVVSIRPGVEWSDGRPWTARDVAFTINMLRQNAPHLVHSTDMETWVSSAIAIDDLTVQISLKAPNPRFLDSYFVHSGDQGVPIVPKHIWENQDPTTFTNFDVKKRWPVLTGPYYMALSEPAQRVWDLRSDWWAAKIGFQKLPEVERLIYLTYMEETKRVQNLITNAIDTCLELRPANIVTLLEANPKITTWTGRNPPYSYKTWWPTSLGFNALEEPWSDPEIRRAINYAINREQLVKVGWQNSGNTSHLPIPDLPQMRPYISATDDLIEKYNVNEFNLDLSARILKSKGYIRSKNFWELDGETLKIVIDIFSHFQDITPVLVAQLKQAGFDASFRMTSDFNTRLRTGAAHAYLTGNFSSMRDPYFVLRQYQSRFLRPTNQPADMPWRWKNVEYDNLIDQMGRTPNHAPEMIKIYRQAMDIWLKELPSIPLVQWPHRIPHNESYWTNWPSEKNPYINSAYWSRTWLLVLLNLKPVG
ncbi:MAG: ABC transporter substrate-binding protein [Candidatus Latescibacterota bacterium]|nr:ABC transporter substrate-binding protein [Candidatus Latescibacterota bacterium]